MNTQNRFETIKYYVEHDLIVTPIESSYKSTVYCQDMAVDQLSQEEAAELLELEGLSTFLMYQGV